MKFFNTILLLILLCSSFEYKSNKNIRKLEEDYTDDIYSDTSDIGDVSDTDYIIEPSDIDSNNKNQTIITPSPQFILLGFGDYKSLNNIISFIVFCKRIFTNVYPRILFITVRIDFGRLRNLEEVQTIECTLIEDPNDINNDNFNYECPLNEKIDNIKQISVDKNFELYEKDEEDKLTKINDVVINPTPNAIKTMDNIQNEKGTKTFFVLQNSTKIQEENKFKINGKIDTPDEDLHNSKFNLNVNEYGNIRQIPCTLYSKKNNENNNDNYELECIPQNSIYASLNNSDGNIKEDKYLVVSMMDENDYIYYNIPNNNYRSKKSSSRGLSGGTIAAIVISCVVAVAAIAIIIVLFNKPNPVSQSQSIPDNQKSSLKMYESNISNNQ